jgi:hypothetical protein
VFVAQAKDHEATDWDEIARFVRQNGGEHHCLATAYARGQLPARVFARAAQLRYVITS